MVNLYTLTLLRLFSSLEKSESSALSAERSVSHECYLVK